MFRSHHAQHQDSASAPPPPPPLSDVTRFSFKTSDPLKTTLVADGLDLAFHVSTPFKLVHSDVTTITREEQGNSRVIATIHWHGYEPEKVQLDLGDGSLVRLLEFFPYDGEFSVKIARTFKFEGDTFEWKWSGKGGRHLNWHVDGGPHFELTDSNQTLLSRDHHVEGKVAPDTHPAYLDVAMNMSDLVVTTYLHVHRAGTKAAVLELD